MQNCLLIATFTKLFHHEMHLLTSSPPHLLTSSPELSRLVSSSRRVVHPLLLVLFAVLLTGLSPSTASAQEGTILVCVLDYCDRDPLAGVSVRQQISPYVPRYATTDNTGCVRFFNDRPASYSLHLPRSGNTGNHHPWLQVQAIQPSSHHSVSKGRTYIEFLVLPMLHIDQLQGQEYAYPQENYSNSGRRTNYAQPFESCIDDEICVGIRQWGNNFTWPNFESYLQKLELNFYFETAKYAGGGRRVAETGFVEYANIRSSDCTGPDGPRKIYGVDLTDVRSQLTVGTIYDLGLEYGCLNESRPRIIPYTMTYQREHYFRVTRGTPPAIVDFQWMVLPGGELDPTQMRTIPNRSTSVQTADRTGYFDIGIEDNNTSGYNPNTGTWGVNLNKVDCETGETLEVLYSTTNSGSITSTRFNSIIIQGQRRWFQERSNTEGFCFEVELWADNGGACSRASKKGWFDPDEDCENCLRLPSQKGDSKDHLTDWQLTLAPNPAANNLVIDANVVFETCQVVDALGRVVQTYHPQSMSWNVDVKGLAPGTFYIRAWSGTSVVTKPFTKL